MLTDPSSQKEYIGDLNADGVRSGQGKLTWVNGDVYTGSWKEGMISGHGKKVYKTSGDIYEGSWEEGIISGKGKFTWATGDVYEGSWREGKKSGYGKMVYKEGSKVEEGVWKDGKFDPSGTRDMFELASRETEHGLRRMGIGRPEVWIPPPLLLASCLLFNGILSLWKVYFKLAREFFLQGDLP
jgi:hypothetical protein